MERTGATNLGIELDASHPFWPWMDPVAVVQHLGPWSSTPQARTSASTRPPRCNGVLVKRLRNDAVYRSTWLAALHPADPDVLVNVEHEDTSLGRIEELEVAAGVLLDAARRAGLG